MRHTYSRHQRLRSSRDFATCYKGVRAGDEHLLVFATPNCQEVTRVGVSVSRKHGNAVVRNRKKRLLREAYRLTQHQLASGLDLILIPRQRATSSRDDYTVSLQRIVRKLVRRLEKSRSTQGHAR